MTKAVKVKTMQGEEKKPLEILENAPLRYLSIDIECLLDENIKMGADAARDKIIMISLAFSPSYRERETLVLVAKQTGIKDKNVINFFNEKEMLSKLLEIISDYDPDVICGYNIFNFDLPYILKRLEMSKLQKDL